jgi:hypothetical protein
MKYGTKETKEEINVISLTRAEYDQLNKLFNDGLTANSANNKDYNSELNTIILTDGFRRLECEIDIVG